MIKIYYKLYRILQIISNALYWLWRDIKYSEFNKGDNVLLNRLLITGHVIEKGITMPNRRLGFGYGQVRTLISLCQKAIQQNLCSSKQYIFALQDLSEYRQIHQGCGFELPEDIKKGINALVKEKKYNKKSTITTKEEFFKKAIDFKEFAHGRHSIRYFSDEHISSETLKSVIELAQTAPSACNRQSVRIHIYDGEKKTELLSIQNGNRGWGNMADKVIIVTSEQTAWEGYFTKAAYLDGGIYTMNLLYALHYYSICACCLNLYLPRKEMKALRNVSAIPNSEIPVVMIAIGKPPKNEFMIANSQRIDSSDITFFHQLDVKKKFS